MATKVDFKRQLEVYSAQPGRFRVVDVPDLQYLMIDGHGDPNTSSEFAAALAALYPLAYRLKFLSKRELGRDYVVMPLEGLWWSDDYAAFTTARDKSRWHWTLLIMVPDWTTREMFTIVHDELAATEPSERLAAVRMEMLSEGRCVQTLHCGPFDDEGPLLAELHDEFIPANGFEMAGKHHEIYLSDRRRTAPESLRTILRQPVTSRPA